MVLSFLKGCGISASLAIAIGPQNSFVLKRGLKRQQVFLVALTCAFFDSVLIILGTAGISEFIKSNNILLEITRWSGFLFLVWYGFRSLKSAFKAQVISLNEEYEPTSKITTIAMLFALSFLNPHALLDTIVLIGGIAVQQPPAERVIFMAGAITASFLWFFCLAYGAFYLAPLLQSKRAWQILDIIICIIMFTIAASLVFIDPASNICR